MTLHVLESGNWEPYMVNFLRRQLNPDDVFVDVGSNIGLTSIYAKDFLYPTIDDQENINVYIVFSSLYQKHSKS